MKILIIGSEGFISGFMMTALQGKGHDVRGMDIGRAKEERGEYVFHKGDIMDAGDIMSAAQGVDLVINLAAKHHDFGIPREDFFFINEKGTQILLSCLAKLGIKKHIFYSSVAVYGTVPECTSEETRINPMNDYGESKLAAEKMISGWVKEDPSREVIVIRPTVIYGPNNWANMYKLINSIYKRQFVMVGKGENIKTISYVENLIDATIFFMERMKPGMDIYNYADYPHLTSAKIIDVITDAMGRGRFKFKIPLRPVLMVTGIVDFVAKITGINFSITANRINKFNMVTWHGAEKLRNLGFKQRIEVEEGLRRMVEWYLSINGVGPS